MRTKKKDIFKKTTAWLLILIVLGGIATGFYYLNKEDRNNALIIYVQDNGVDKSLLTSFERYYREISGNKLFTVRASYYINNERAYDNLTNGELRDKDFYDVVVTGTYCAAKLREEGILATLDCSRLSNVVNIDEDILAFSQELFTDGGGVFALPFATGVLGILYNKQGVDTTNLTDFSVLFDGSLKKKTLFPDSFKEVLSVARLAEIQEADMTFDQLDNLINTYNESAIDGIFAFLKRSNSTNKVAYAASSTMDDLAQGKFTAYLAYSDFAQYNMKKFDNLDFALPEGGRIIKLDGISLTSKAGNPGAAYEFINYMLRGASAVNNNHNAAHISTLKKEVISDSKTEAKAIVNLELLPVDVSYMFEREDRLGKMFDTASYVDFSAIEQGKTVIIKENGRYSDELFIFTEAKPFRIESWHIGLLGIIGVVLVMVGLFAFGIKYRYFKKADFIKKKRSQNEKA